MSKSPSKHNRIQFSKMDFPLSRLFCVHHFPEGSTLIEKYKPFSIKTHENHYLFHIEDTIHWNVMKTNDFSEYNIYIEAAKQKEHSEANFRSLIDT